MAAWNYTSHSPVEVFQGINTLTNQLFGVSILVIIWLIIYMRNKNEGNRDSIVGASFIASIAGILMSFIGLVSDTVLGICIFLFLGSLALLINRPPGG